jgi:hypothetical protein
MKHLEQYDRFSHGPITKNKVNENLQYHIDNNISLSENVFRMGSTAYFQLFNDARCLYNTGELNVCEDDKWFLESDIGKQASYEGEDVWLDIPFTDETIDEAEYKGKTVELNKPKRGGVKKFYVYVMDNDKVKKISFGAADGGNNLAVKLQDPVARANFASRHKCETKNDKTTPGYWSCRLPRFAKQLGLSGGGKWW